MYIITQQFLLFGGPWAQLMCRPATTMFMTNSMLLWSVACRGLVMPGATACLDAPLLNSNIEQWRMVVLLLDIRCL